MAAVIALLLSSLAVALSAGALVFNVRGRRRDLFLTMHERLLDEDIRCGRRDLFASSVDSVDTARLFRTAKPREYERACRALAMFDVLGCYVERGYIDKPIVLDEWGHTYAQVWLKGQYIVSLRLEDDKGLWSAWPHFQTFGEEASRWAAGRRRGLVRQEVQRDA